MPTNISSPPHLWLERVCSIDSQQAAASCIITNPSSSPYPLCRYGFEPTLTYPTRATSLGSPNLLLLSISATATCPAVSLLRGVYASSKPHPKFDQRPPRLHISPGRERIPCFAARIFSFTFRCVLHFVTFSARSSSPAPTNTAAPFRVGTGLPLCPALFRAAPARIYSLPSAPPSPHPSPTPPKNLTPVLFPFLSLTIPLFVFCLFRSRSFLKVFFLYASRLRKRTRGPTATTLATVTRSTTLCLVFDDSHCDLDCRDSNLAQQHNKGSQERLQEVAIQRAHLRASNTAASLVSLQRLHHQSFWTS